MCVWLSIILEFPYRNEMLLKQASFFLKYQTFMFLSPNFPSLNVKRNCLFDPSFGFLFHVSVLIVSPTIRKKPN